MLHISPPSSSEDEGSSDEEAEEAEIDDAMDEDPLSPRRDSNVNMDEDTNMMTPGADDGIGLGLLDDTVGKTEQDSDSDDGPDGLFEDDDDEDEDNDDAGEAGAAGGATSGSQPQVGEKRKLDEDDEYD